ncbi:MAG: hypothetical protein V7746_19595 [Halioglobus sp.]
MPELIACTSDPERTDRLAVHAGFSKVLVVGKLFQHVTYQHRLDQASTQELHIYIEGDGTPWIQGRYPAAEPTPRHPLALELMALDPGPALYVGRPCYLGMAKSAYCEVELWTSRRYSPEVVASMLEVIEQYLRRFEIKRVVLIGYSGGGTLAALIAPRLHVQVFLLTLAANLDTDLWTSLQGFLPLEGSLNPLDYRPAIAQTPQLHLVGLRDSNVPTAVTESFTNGLHPQTVRVFPEFDHSCCWLDIWPSILADTPWKRADYSRYSRERIGHTIPLLE